MNCDTISYEALALLKLHTYRFNYAKADKKHKATGNSNLQKHRIYEQMQIFVTSGKNIPGASHLAAE